MDTHLTWEEIGRWRQGTDYIRAYSWDEQCFHYGNNRKSEKGIHFRHYKLRLMDLVVAKMCDYPRNRALSTCDIKSFALKNISPEFKVNFDRKRGNVARKTLSGNRTDSLAFSGVTFGLISEQHGTRKLMECPEDPEYRYAISTFHGPDFMRGFDIEVGAGEVIEFGGFLEELVKVLKFHRKIAAGKEQLADVKGEFILPAEYSDYSKTYFPGYNSEQG